MGNSKGEYKWQYIVVIILILLAGLRNRVGGDTINYELHFNEWPDLHTLFSQGFTFSGITQPLWYLINVALKSVWNNFLTVQLFHAIVFNLLLHRFFRKTTDKIFTAFLVTYCMIWWNFNFEVLRESLCVALYLNSLLFLKQKNLKMYILFNIPALFIHYFSFVIIIITFFLYYSGKKTVMVFTTVFAFIFLIMDTASISNYITQIVVVTAEDTSSIVVDRYIEGENYGYNSLNIKGLLLQVILLLQPIIVSANLKTEDKTLNVKLLWLYMLLFVLTSKFVILSRFLNYLVPFLIIETICYLYRNKNLKSISYYIVTLLLLYNVGASIREFYMPSVYLKTNLTYDCRYIPYTTIFHKPDPIRERYYGK